MDRNNCVHHFEFRAMLVYHFDRSPAYLNAYSSIQNISGSQAPVTESAFSFQPRTPPGTQKCSTLPGVSVATVASQQQIAVMIRFRAGRIFCQCDDDGIPVQLTVPGGAIERLI